VAGADALAAPAKDIEEDVERQEGSAGTRGAKKGSAARCAAETEPRGLHPAREMSVGAPAQAPRTTSLLLPLSQHAAGWPTAAQRQAAVQCGSKLTAAAGCLQSCVRGETAAGRA
jgi:hypothetical protein